MKKNLTIVVLLAISVIFAGTASAQPQISIDDAYMVINAPSDFNFKVCDCGDVNGDDYDDIVVAAPGPDVADVGRIYFYSGNPVNPMVPEILYTFEGRTWSCTNVYGNNTNGGDRIGIDIDNIGDGVPDLAACAPYACEYNPNGSGNATWEGRFYIIYGRGDIRTETHWSRIDGIAEYLHRGYGKAASWAGDIDGNNRDEFLMSQSNAWTAGSFTRLYEGPAAGLSPDPDLDTVTDIDNEVDWVFTVARDYAASAGYKASHVSNYGDVDGNGGADYGFGGSHYFNVLSGESEGTFWLNEWISQEVGAITDLRLSGPFNANNDGFSDVLIYNTSTCCKGFNIWYGRSDFFTVPSDAASPDLTIPPPTGSGIFPTDFAVVGDFNGDGYDDFMASQNNVYVAGAKVGKVWVYSGFDGSVMVTFVGAEHWDMIGLDLSRAGDVNNDGYNDILITADSPKRVIVFLGGEDTNANGTPDRYEAGYTPSGVLISQSLGDGWELTFDEVTVGGFTTATL